MSTPNNIEIARTIFRTKDYTIFKSVKSNRELVGRHVRALMKSIKQRNLLHIMPGIINSNYELLDGQHRLESCVRLDEWFYFVVDDQLTKEDIAIMNSNKKNWSVMDYVTYYSVEGNPAFVKLSKFIYEFPQMQIGNALILLSSTGSRRTADIKYGVVDIGNYDKAVKVAKMCQDYGNFIDKPFERKFLKAVRLLSDSDKYNHSSVIEFLVEKRVTIEKQLSSMEYIKFIQEKTNIDFEITNAKHLN